MSASLALLTGPTTVTCRYAYMLSYAELDVSYSFLTMHTLALTHAVLV